MLTYREFAKYGVQTTFYFALEDVSDVEAPFTGAAPVTGDIWISKDGGAAANATNAFTAISNGLYSWVATATEMQATRLIVNVYDATASAIFRPITVLILTKLQLGQIDVDATQIGGNTSGILATGVGTEHGMALQGGATGGHGLQAVGGTTNGYGGRFAGGATIGGGLLCTAPTDGPGLWCLGKNATTQEWGGIVAFGNGGASANTHGMLLVGSGTGAGLYTQGAVATHTAANGEGVYISGATAGGNGITVATVAGNSSGIVATGRGTGQGLSVLHATDNSLMSVGTGLGLSVTHATDNSLMTNIFDTLEGTEPSAAVSNNATFKQIFQYLKRRFLNLVTQTSTVQTIYKDDSVTPLTTMACSNDGTTQSKGKSS